MFKCTGPCGRIYIEAPESFDLADNPICAKCSAPRPRQPGDVSQETDWSAGQIHDDDPDRA